MRGEGGANPEKLRPRGVGPRVGGPVEIRCEHQNRNTGKKHPQDQQKQQEAAKAAAAGTNMKAGEKQHKQQDEQYKHFERSEVAGWFFPSSRVKFHSFFCSRWRLRGISVVFVVDPPKCTYGVLWPSASPGGHNTTFFSKIILYCCNLRDVFGFLSTLSFCIPKKFFASRKKFSVTRKKPLYPEKKLLYPPKKFFLYPEKGFCIPISTSFAERCITQKPFVHQKKVAPLPFCLPCRNRHSLKSPTRTRAFASAAVQDVQCRDHIKWSASVRKVGVRVVYALFTISPLSLLLH